MTEGGPLETLLPFTESHVSIINKAHQQAKKLLELSQHLEGVLYRVAEDKLISNGAAVVLELNSFDDDCAAWNRDDLFESLGPHKDFMLPLMPRLVQRWQSDKLEKAVNSLADIERTMKTWIQAHGQDPANQGVHLDEKKLYRDIEAAEDTKLCWNALRDTTPVSPCRSVTSDEGWTIANLDYALPFRPLRLVRVWSTVPRSIEVLISDCLKSRPHEGITPPT